MVWMDFDQEDWSLFSGAKPFVGGETPMVNYEVAADWYGVIDGKGIEFGRADTGSVFRLNHEFEKSIALLIAREITRNFSLSRLGSNGFIIV